MATGVTKRHSRDCATRNEGRCDCEAGYQAWVYLAREEKKTYKTFARFDDAKVWRTETLAAANRGTLQLPNRDPRSLAFALQRLIEAMQAGTVRPKNRQRYKPSTVRNYDQHLRRRISPTPLGSMRVSEVRRPDVQDFVDEMLADGLSPSTVKNILNPIQTFYRRAKDREELIHNPTERIDVPSARSRRPRRIASREEAAQLLLPLPAIDQAIWATAFYAGLRRGELQALRCRDVDLASCRISVERAWDQYEGVIDTKSDAGDREVPLLATLRDFLDEHLWRTGRQGADLIFGRTAKDAFVPTTISDRAQEAWKAAHLRAITLHGCRHTFASLLIDSGANPKAIQIFMGHSNIQTTFDIYGHLLPGSHDEVRSRMDAYLATEGPSAGAQASPDWCATGAQPETANPKPCESKGSGCPQTAPESQPNKKRPHRGRRPGDTATGIRMVQRCS